MQVHNNPTDNSLQHLNHNAGSDSFIQKEEQKKKRWSFQGIIQFSLLIDCYMNIILLFTLFLSILYLRNKEHFFNVSEHIMYEVVALKCYILIGT